MKKFRIRIEKSNYLLIHILVVVVVGLVGILCMWLGNDFFVNVGSVLFISGIYTVVDNMLLKESLIDLVIQKVQLDHEIDNSGLIKLDTTLTNT